MTCIQPPPGGSGAYWFVIVRDHRFAALLLGLRRHCSFHRSPYPQTLRRIPAVARICHWTVRCSSDGVFWPFSSSVKSVWAWSAKPRPASA